MAPLSPATQTVETPVVDLPHLHSVGCHSCHQLWQENAKLRKELGDPPPGYYRASGQIQASEENAENAVRILLYHIGEDPTRNGLLDTPRRVAKAYREMTVGYKQDPAQILSVTFEEQYDEVIILRNTPFVSLCEHHCLPFIGAVDIGYLPGKVVGLSKLARLVDCFAKRLQIQERMTKEIAGAISDHLQAKGVAVVVRAEHSCMACRGVQKPGASMITSVMTGIFRDKSEARAEFLSLSR